MEIRGKIIQILPLQSGVGQQSGKEWKKQEYILETDGQYPKKICFNLWGDAIDRSQIQLNEEVLVHVDIESREYNGRWYTDIKGWRVDRGPFPQMQPLGAVPPAVASFTQAPQGVNSSPSMNDIPDDLPF